MPDERTSERAEPGGEDALHFAGGARRASYRRLFREMIKLEIGDRRAGRLRRRALVRFARRLGISDFEARLLIRAVEYECGCRPASTRGASADSAESPSCDRAEHRSALRAERRSRRERLGELEAGAVWLDRNLFWPAAFAAVSLLYWLLR